MTCALSSKDTDNTPSRTVVAAHRGPMTTIGDTSTSRALGSAMRRDGHFDAGVGFCGCIVMLLIRHDPFSLTNSSEWT